VTGRLPKLNWRDITQKKIVQYVQKNRDSLIMDAIIGIVVFKVGLTPPPPTVRGKAVAEELPEFQG
jgi:hypothetical protein